jgi:amino acid transporter
MIAACIAEMASSIPSSSGVYHWASVTGGARFGKIIGYYAGWYVSKNTASEAYIYTSPPRISVK